MMNIVCDTDELTSSIQFILDVVQLLGYPKDKEHTLGNLIFSHIYNDFVYFHIL